VNLLAFLNPYRWIALAVLIAALAIGIPLAIHHHDAKQQDIGYQKRAAEDKAAADKQTAANLDLQRAAEKHYTVQRDSQDHYFTTTVKEVIHDAAPLAVCPLGPELVRVLNDANHCASADPGPTCGALGEVPTP
jgi:hypothetical protein